MGKSIQLRKEVKRLQAEVAKAKAKELDKLKKGDEVPKAKEPEVLKKANEAPKGIAKAVPKLNESIMRQYGPKLQNFSRALWRGSTRFSRTFLSFAGVVMLNSSKTLLNVAKSTPHWLRTKWPTEYLKLSDARAPDKPKDESAGTMSEPGKPKDDWAGTISGLSHHQLQAMESLQRTLNERFEKDMNKNTNIHLDQHIQRTEGSVSISIRNTSSIRIESAGGEPGSSTQLPPAPSTIPPSTSPPNIDLAEASRDEVWAHLDMVMQRLPIPAKATLTSAKPAAQDLVNLRAKLKNDVLRSYDAVHGGSQDLKWCCIRREWMKPSKVRTAHLCAVSLGDNYLQYVFGDKGPHLWNPENAIPISNELEEALDFGQIAIVPAQPDDVDDSFDPYESIPRENRFKVVVFDDSVSTNDGTLSGEDLHGRLLGFQDPNFRPGLRYICLNVITTLARRRRYKVVGSHNDLNRLGDARFMLSPRQFIRDAWLLRMCAELGIDFGDAAPSNYTPLPPPAPIVEPSSVQPVRRRLRRSEPKSTSRRLIRYFDSLSTRPPPASCSPQQNYEKHSLKRVTPRRKADPAPPPPQEPVSQPPPEDDAAPPEQQISQPAVSKTDASETDASKTDASKTDASEIDASKTDASKTDTSSALSTAPEPESEPTKGTAAPLFTGLAFKGRSKPTTTASAPSPPSPSAPPPEKAQQQKQPTTTTPKQTQPAPAAPTPTPTPPPIIVLPAPSTVGQEQEQDDKLLTGGLQLQLQPAAAAEAAVQAATNNTAPTSLTIKLPEPLALEKEKRGEDWWQDDEESDMWSPPNPDRLV